MSYDTEIQKILLVKLITNACRTRIKSDRQFKWTCQTVTLRYLTGIGKTSLPMNSVPDTRGNLRSRKLSANWYDMKIFETEIDGAIHWKLVLPKLIITFRRNGSHEFTAEPFKVTQEEK